MQEYYEKLCKKFPEITFNTGSSLMSGNENKVVINLSSECLKKMANDPEFAKKVEFNLTGAVPGQNRMFAQAKADNAVIHGVTTVIDAAFYLPMTTHNSLAGSHRQIKMQYR